jgi:hypothetical protein
VKIDPRQTVAEIAKKHKIDLERLLKELDDHQE